MIDKTMELIRFADLSYPVEIRLKELMSLYVAEHQSRYNQHGIIKKHIIWIYMRELMQDSRDYYSILAHELIHAMQAENEIDEWHGLYFKERANEFETEFPFLNNVFDPSIDKNP